MARDFNGSTDRIDYTSVQDANAANSCAMWIRPDAYPGPAHFMFVAHTSGDAALGSIFAVIAGPPFELFFQVVAATGQPFKTTEVTISTGTWSHIAYTWDGSVNSSGINLYLNGALQTAARTNEGSGLAAQAGSWSLGGRIYDDTRNFDGRIANVGWWNRVLSLAEIQMLADGFAPRCIPRGLKFAPDLVREIRDPVSGRTGTADGTSVAAHPRTVWPVSGRMVARVTAAAGSPWYYYAQLM